MVKTDKTTAARTVYTALQAINALKILYAPVVPFSSEKLHRLLGYERPLFGQSKIVPRQERQNTCDVLRYDATEASGQWQVELLPVHRILPKPDALFKKLDDAIIQIEIKSYGNPIRYLKG